MALSIGESVWKFRVKVDNRQLFGTDKHVNQLYLSSGRIYKMGEHGPNDASPVETGKFHSFVFLCLWCCVHARKNIVCFCFWWSKLCWKFNRLNASIGLFITASKIRNGKMCCCCSFVFSLIVSLRRNKNVHCERYRMNHTSWAPAYFPCSWFVLATHQSTREGKKDEAIFQFDTSRFFFVRLSLFWRLCVGSGLLIQKWYWIFPIFFSSSYKFRLHFMLCDRIANHI